jgi:hypothetical protein
MWFSAEWCSSPPEELLSAEIAILNKEAVALAADGSVTLMSGPAENPHQVFTSANKIFRLPGTHTVSFMIYNNAGFMGIPWEPVITRFGESVGPSPLPYLAEYAGRFLGFLKNERELITAAIEEQYFTSMIYTCYVSFRQVFRESASEMIRDRGVISEDQIGDFVAEKINNAYTLITSNKTVPGIGPDFIKELSKAWDATTTRAMSEIFEQLPIPEPAQVQLKEIPFLLFGRFAGDLDPAYQNFSGIVIAGFGEKEVFPSLVSYAIDGRLAGTLKYRELGIKTISLRDSAYVIPFAEREMVDIFMSSIDPRLTDALVTSLSEIFHEYPPAIIDSIETMSEEEKTNLKTQFEPKSDELAARISTYLENYRASNTAPLISAVATLPKQELAAMAESLVNLASLKRKVSSPAGATGGPVDVALISKRDGFVWIRKKEYFDPDINPQVIQRY